MYINYYHKYIFKCVFVTVLNFKSQTPVWAHKYSFTVKQKRDTRLNIYFLRNMPRPNSQLPGRFFSGFFVLLYFFCIKALTTKNDRLTPPTRFQVNPLKPLSLCKSDQLELYPKAFMGGKLLLSGSLSHQRGSENVYSVTQVQCRKTTVLGHSENKSNLGGNFKVCEQQSCRAVR